MLDPRDAIDRINDIYGRHPHHRALHARGTFYTGTFTATPEATALCRAEPFSGVLVRWSNGGGNPERHDNHPDVRGMAVKLQGDGGDTDLLGQTSPRFPVRTPEDFISMTAAAQGQLTFPLWVLRHPATVPALVAGLRARALGPPYSYAEVRGPVEITDDPAAELIEELSQKYTGRPFGDRPGERRVIVRVRPEHVVLYD